MFTASNRPQYNQNVPHSIQEKISLLFVFENLIINLETQLQSMRTEYSRLQADVEPYQIQDEPESSSTTRRASITTRSPISRCPNEVLYLIFQQCLVPRHRELGKLLFVCKRWNSVVMSSPGLWAKIEVPNPLDFFQDSRRSSALSYIEACNARSRDVLLDVELDLESAPHYSGFIAAQLAECAHQVVEGEDEEYILDQIGAMEWDYKPRSYDQFFKQFTDCIFGIDHAHLRRWASLRLTMPYNTKAAIEIWKKISFSFPNLKVLFIEGIPPEMLPPNESSNLTIPSVESLVVKLEQIPTPLSLFHVSHDVLTHLSLDFGQRLENILDISSLTALRSLELMGRLCDYDDYDGWVPPDPSTWPIFSLHLPLLTELRLWGEYEALQAVRFDLPALDTLKVCSTGDWNKLPTVAPRHVYWRVQEYITDFDNVIKPPLVDAALKNFIELSFSSITVIEKAKTTSLEWSGPTRTSRLRGKRNESWVQKIDSIKLYIEEESGKTYLLDNVQKRDMVILAMTS